MQASEVPARSGGGRRLPAVLIGLTLALLVIGGGAWLAWETAPLLRARHALQMALGRENTAVTLEIEGVGPVPMFLDPTAAVLTSFVEREGIWEPRETSVFVDGIGEGDVVVDVGANVGYYTLLAARRVGPSGRVYAFEPDPRNFAYLERNVRLNGFDNVVLEQKAIADRNGTLKLFVTDGAHEDSRIFAPAGRTSQAVEVEAVTLDDYFRGREERLDFVKIDVQGAEGAVLAGMEEIAKSSPDLGMVLELSPGLVRETGIDPDALVDRLAGPFRMFTFENGLTPIDPATLKNSAWQSANLFLARRGGRRDPGTDVAVTATSGDGTGKPGRRRRPGVGQVRRVRMAAVKADPMPFLEQARQGDSVIVYEDNVPVLRLGPIEKRPMRRRRR